MSASESREVPARASAFPVQEPPAGSVVAIDWGGHYQEVWVASSANGGNWHSPDIPLRGDAHPTWRDVTERARGRSLVLLVPGDSAAYAAGWAAAIDATSVALQAAIGELPFRPPAREAP